MRSPLVLFAASAALALAAAAPGHSQGEAVDPTRDSRLARRLYLRSEGIPVSHVLKRLAEKTGVLLTVSGAPGDERLVAFAPDTTLAEAMRSIAELYGLRWMRTTADGKPAYQLLKPLERARQEAELKRAALQVALADLGRQARTPLRPNPQDPEGHHAALRKAAIDSVNGVWERLARDGYLELHLGQLPEAFAREVRTHGPPSAAATQSSVLESDRRLREILLQQGEKLPDDLKEEPKPHPISPMDEWRVTYDLKADQGLELRITFWPARFGSVLFQGQADPGPSGGMSLYEAKRPRPTGVGPAPPLPADDPLGRKLTVLNSSLLQPSHLSTPWLTAMENLAQYAGVAVYTDDYSNPDPAGKQREAEPLKHGSTAAEYLDSVCKQRQGYALRSCPPAFWWREGKSVLVRSRSFLFEAESVIPASLVDRFLARRGPGEQNLAGPADLVELSRVTMTQLQGMAEGNPVVGWREAISLPARLGPVSRALVTGGGLTWENMPPADRAVAEQLAGEFGVTPGRYRAKVEVTATHPSWRSRSALHVAIATAATPGSSYRVAIPAPQANPQGLLVISPGRVRTPAKRPERLVFALYYPWYATQPVSGETRKLRVADGRVQNFAHQPAAGPYDSSDEDVIRRHVTQMKAAGIDVICCYWPGPDTFEGRVVKKLLPIARAEGLRVCLQIDDGRVVSAAIFQADMAAWMKSFAAEEAYLKVEGRPVVFLGYSILNRYSLQEWDNIFEGAEKEGGPGVIAIGRGVTPVEIAVFSGTNLTAGISWSDGQQALSIARSARDWAMERVVAVREHGRLAIVQAQPGFDVRHFSKDSSPIDRAGGGFYKALWDTAQDIDADWVLIDSFNQWETGTEIEPSREFGDAYLKSTAELARRFKAPGK